MARTWVERLQAQHTRLNDEARPDEGGVVIDARHAADVRPLHQTCVEANGEANSGRAPGPVRNGQEATRRKGDKKVEAAARARRKAPRDTHQR